MSYFDCNGRVDYQATSKLLGALIALRTAGIDKNLLIELNDSGFMFNEIDDYMDRINKHSNMVE
jgi:hypothetical protein